MTWICDSESDFQLEREENVILQVTEDRNGSETAKGKSEYIVATSVTSH